MGKAIYQPKGKAKEYSPWAVNLYNGCPHLCQYCYNRKGVAYKVLGKDVPTLKESLKNKKQECDENGNVLSDENYAYSVFKNEIIKVADEVRESGLFFNFVSDPCLPETYKLNWACIMFAIYYKKVPCTILTKRADWLDYPEWVESFNDKRIKDFVKVGFTLTGCDDQEPYASKNAERIEAMKRLHEMGIKTWASIEPILNLSMSAQMICDSLLWCDEYKIGLLSGKKPYTPEEVRLFFGDMNKMFGELAHPKKVLWKDSVYDFIK